MTQELVRKHAGHHGFADRNGADADARIVAAFGDNLGFAAKTVDGAARLQDRRGWLDGKARHDGLAGGDAAQNAARVVREEKRDGILAAPHLIGVGLARKFSRRETIADFDALDGVDRHQGSGKFRIELAVDGRAPSWRDVLSNNLDDSANG